MATFAANSALGFDTMVRFWLRVKMFERNRENDVFCGGWAAFLRWAATPGRNVASLETRSFPPRLVRR